MSEFVDIFEKNSVIQNNQLSTHHPLFNRITREVVNQYLFPYYVANNSKTKSSISFLIVIVLVSEVLFILTTSLINIFILSILLCLVYLHYLFNNRIQYRFISKPVLKFLISKDLINNESIVPQKWLKNISKIQERITELDSGFE